MLAISQPPPTIVKRAMIKTGTYTGNDNDDRTINIGIDLNAKDNVTVIVKALAAVYGVFRTEYSQGDQSMFFGADTDQANLIQSFTNTGFQVGSQANVNQNTVVYRYIAFWEEP